MAEFIQDPAILVAMMLLAALLGGYTAVAMHVPRVVGYLVAGVLLQLALPPLLEWNTPEPIAHEHLAQSAKYLSGIKTLALGLIMFSIGGVFEARHMRSIGDKIVKISLIKNACVFLLVTLGCAAAVIIGGGVSISSAMAFGLLMGIVGIATAPAATLLVLREYEAKGNIADTILTLTAVNNTLCIVLFHAAFLILAACGLINAAGGDDRLLWLDLLLTSVGSIALGALLGFIFTVVYNKLSLTEFLLIFLAVVLSLGAFREYFTEVWHLSFNFLLTCLFLGGVFANITSDTDPFDNLLRHIGAPLFALFFVLAGYELHLEDLPKLGLLGVSYVALRLLGKWLGGWLGIRAVGHAEEAARYLGFGMLCQAGVAIGLADFVARTWGTPTPDGFQPHALAVQLKTAVLGSVVVFELIGPFALKAAVKRAGEIKAVTLMRRRPRESQPGASNARLAAEALNSLLGVKRRKAAAAPPERTAELQVRDIMRANVKLLRADARFEEVLKFVESSRFNHFPVVDADDRFVGMIHFADLRDILYDHALRELVTAHDLARQDAPLVPRDMPISDLFKAFQSTDMGSIAVTDTNGKRSVVGIVEQRDLLAAIREQTSTGRKAKARR